MPGGHELMPDPTKRETCKWAEPSSLVWSKCVYPLPPCVSRLDRYADNATCNSCPCHEPKEDRDA